jgi:hypothetical protein
VGGHPPGEGALVVLAAEWRRRADQVDRAEHIAAALPARHQPGRSSVDEHAFAGVLEPLPHRGAYRRDVVQAFAAAAPDGAPAPWVEELAASWVPQPATTAVGVAEPLHRRADVVPGGHLVEALGPRPLDPRAHGVWREAARAIEAYRQRWGLTRTHNALGLDDPSSLATLGAARLADHARTTRGVAAARARLGRREPPAVELFLER